MQIYLARNNVQAGPYSLEQLNTMLQSGEVQLTDLAWHVGMNNWQVLDELTDGRMIYEPSASVLKLANQASQANTTQSQTGTNTAQTQSEQNTSNNEKRRLTVAELYGRKPQSPEQPQNQSQPTPDNRPTPRGQPEWMGRHRTPSTTPIADGEVVYASIGSRLLAFAINMSLFVATVMPLQLAIVDSGIKPEQLNNIKNMADYQALGEQISKSIDSSTIMLTFGLLVGLGLIQLIMLARRGQSIGKLITGIRVVDEKTYKVPDAGKMIGTRTILLFVIYQVASIFSFVATILLAVNYILASSNPKKQGWHDKLAKTVVVKANPNQLNKK